MRRLVVTAVTLLLTIAALLVAPSTGPALAADPPPNPSDAQIGAAQASQQALAAQLGSLQAQAAQLQGQIDGLAASANAAIARYEQTTQDVAAAVDAATRAKADLDAANAEVDTARDVLNVIARDTYLSSVANNGGASLLFAGSDDVDFTLTAANYLAARRDGALSRVEVAGVAAANAESARRDAVAKAEDLQRQADAQQKVALDALETARTAQTQLQVTLTDVNAQAATAAAALSGLLDQRTAYEAYLAELARQEAARQEAARQAALAAAAAQAQQGAGGPEGTAVGAVAPPPVPHGNWVRPLTAYRISSCYCMRGGTFHRGVDLAAPLGTPMFAVGNGTVIRSGPASGFGNWVVIDHHDGTVSIYGHMRVLVARVGQDVGPGTLIAYVGSEGESTGAHLHFEIRVGGPNGRSTDPIVWLRQRGITL